MPRAKNRKQVIIMIPQLDTPVQRLIDIPFLTDEIIVRSVSFTQTTLTNVASEYISTDLIDNRFLCSITNSATTYCPGTTFLFPGGRMFQGHYQFAGRDWGTNGASFNQGTCLILLEFVQYE
jgi:hypothetical protein